MPLEDADGNPIQAAQIPFNSSKYDTKLSPQDELQFQSWKSKYAPNDSGADYDLRGAYKAGIKPDAQRGHFPDTFKKPNHPTFSTESQYSGKDGFVGGKWGEGDSYTPSPTNLQFKNPQQLQQYFQQNEPNSKLNLPPQGLEDIDGNPIQPKIVSNIPQRSQLPGGDETNIGKELSNVGKRIPSTLPIIGGVLGGVPGAAAGSFAKQALSTDPSITSGVGDTILNGVIPAGIEAGFTGGVKASASRLLSKLPDSILQYIPGYAKAQIAAKLANKMYPEADLVQTAAQNASDQAGKMSTQIENSKFSGNLGLKGPGLVNSMSPEETAAVAKYNSKYADNKIGQQLLDIRKQMGVSGDQPLSAVPKLMMSDVKHVENAILATGDPTIVKQIATNDLVTRHFTPSSKTFDAAGMLDEMAGTKADAYKLALGKGYQPFKELLDLGVQKGVGKQTPNLFSWQEGRKLAITGTALQFLGIPFKATEAVVLGADAMRKIAGDPALGKLILQAAKTGSKAPQSGLLMKAALTGLRGTTLYLTGPDGQKDEVQVGQDQQGNPQLQTAAPKR
jgi:hypothetical protein